MTEPNLSLDDVLDIVMFEEDTPSDDALLRWRERYPQYRRELTEYFETWALQEARAQVLPAVEIDEDWFADLGGAFARQVLRRQAAKVSEDAIEPLNSFEQLILTAIRHLRTPRACYVERITAKVRELAGREVPESSIMETLNRLDSRYVVFSWSPDPAKYPGEAGRTYFVLTPMGERSLENVSPCG